VVQSEEEDEGSEPEGDDGDNGTDLADTPEEEGATSAVEDEALEREDEIGMRCRVDTG
jgi:hypothetical protein